MTTHSPSRIIAEFLISQGIGTDITDDSAWPVFVNYRPDETGVPDNCIVVYDNLGAKDGRLMVGTLILHPGFQVMVRARTHPVGWAKANAISDALAGVNRDVQEVITDSCSFNRYRLDNTSQSGTILPLGLEKGTKRRHLFTINYLATLEETTLVITASTMNVLPHTVSGDITAVQMENWLHTNSGAGASAITLNLPAAAAGLNAIFAQVDAGDLVINPQDGDQIYSSTGAVTSGGAFTLENPTSVMWLVSDGAGRWIVLQESGQTAIEGE